MYLPLRLLTAGRAADSPASSHLACSDALASPFDSPSAVGPLLYRGGVCCGYARRLPWRLPVCVCVRARAADEKWTRGQARFLEPAASRLVAPLTKPPVRCLQSRRGFGPKQETLAQRSYRSEPARYTDAAGRRPPRCSTRRGVDRISTYLLIFFLF